MNIQNSTTFGFVNVITLKSFAFDRITFKPKVKLEKVKVLLNRVNLKSLIEAENGRFVSVDYIRADGIKRTLTGRLGVTSFLNGGQNTVEKDERPYLTMFDIQLRQYRTVNLKTVSAMRCNNKVYTIID